MRKSLDTEAEHQLKIRVFIAKKLHVFSRADIAEGFNISLKTLNCYISPEYRRYHTQYALKQTQAKKLVNKALCWRCGNPTATHRRCEDCTILLHVSDRYCNSCARLHGHISLY